MRVIQRRPKEWYYSGGAEPVGLMFTVPFLRSPAAATLVSLSWVSSWRGSPLPVPCTGAIPARKVDALMDALGYASGISNWGVSRICLSCTT